jgi:hypothetical protein
VFDSYTVWKYLFVTRENKYKKLKYIHFDHDILNQIGASLEHEWLIILYF